MRSSISSSDEGKMQQKLNRPGATFCVGMLLTVMGVVLVALECFSRLFVESLSNDLNRIAVEVRQANNISKGTGTESVLFVGNSLLLWGVDMDLSNSLETSKVNYSRLVIQQTTYYDWYFGIKNLFGEPGAARNVVLFLEPLHLIQTSVRSEFFAHYLVDRSDLFEVYSELDLSPTELTDLWLASVSKFYALRKEIRKFVLQRLVPRFESLTALFVPSGRPEISEKELKEKVSKRLNSLHGLEEWYHGKITVVLIPPTDEKQAELIMEIGKQENVTVLYPLKHSGLSVADFQSDGYHLNQQGRVKFTRALVESL